MSHLTEAELEAYVQARIKELRRWRVHVAVDLQPRQRKYTVRMYQVVCATAEEAKVKVQQHLDHVETHRRYEIICAENFSGLDSVQYLGCYFRTPLELAAMKERA